MPGEKGHCAFAQGLVKTGLGVNVQGRPEGSVFGGGPDLHQILRTKPGERGAKHREQWKILPGVVQDQEDALEVERLGAPHEAGRGCLQRNPACCKDARINLCATLRCAHENHHIAPSHWPRLAILDDLGARVP